MNGVNAQVKKIIIAENISQTEIAKKMNCTKQNINDKLNDGNMYVSTLEKLLDTIGYEVILQKKS